MTVMAQKKKNNMEPENKKSAFKLKSGNKPSPTKFFGALSRQKLLKKGFEGFKGLQTIDRNKPQFPNPNDMQSILSFFGHRRRKARTIPSYTSGGI